MEGSDVAPASSSDAPTKKERQFVAWTPEEDDLLREQIALHGTNNWTSVLANFKDKTSRQCRRRWCTYLNTESKKGGWSAEEDMLLCEAQKILGNRWTEIAKVVAGRTDNAVKNRFSTLCKKRAKDETLYKENNMPCVNTYSDKYLFTRDRLISAGIDVSSLPTKKMRYDRSYSGERMTTTDIFLNPQVTEREQLRQPLVEVSHNAGYSKEPEMNVSGAVPKGKGTFLQKDNPKLIALLQKAEPLSSLAITVNTESLKERLDEASKKLQDGSRSAIKDWADSFASPIQKFPGFQSLADAIPCPKFSESERKFLLTMFGTSSPVSNMDCSKDLSCKRALFDSL